MFWYLSKYILTGFRYLCYRLYHPYLLAITQNCAIWIFVPSYPHTNISFSNTLEYRSFNFQLIWAMIPWCERNWKMLWIQLTQQQHHNRSCTSELLLENRRSSFLSKNAQCAKISKKVPQIHGIDCFTFFLLNYFIKQYTKTMIVSF